MWFLANKENFRLKLCLSACSPVCLSVSLCLSVCLFVCLSVCLAVFLYVCRCNKICWVPVCSNCLCFRCSLLRRRSLGSSRNIPPPRGEEYFVTSPKSVCVGGHFRCARLDYLWWGGEWIKFLRNVDTLLQTIKGVRSELIALEIYRETWKRHSVKL